MKTADQILKDHEDAKEMHFHQVDREWIIEAMEEYAKTTRPWIRPQDQMPKDGERVLVCNEIGIKSVASHDTYYNEWNSDDSFWWPREVTHWMPLPEPPKGLNQPFVVGRSEQLVCDRCGCHPTLIYSSEKGRFCITCKPAS